LHAAIFSLYQKEETTMADHHRIVTILTKYARRRRLSRAETRLLEEWMAKSDEHRNLPEQLRDPGWHRQHQRDLENAPSAEMWENIVRTMEGSGERAYRQPRLAPLVTRWIAGMAAGFLVFATGDILYSHFQKKIVTGASADARPALAQTPAIADFKARITRDDGSAVLLDTLPDGAEVIDGAGGRAIWAGGNTLTYPGGGPAEGVHQLTIGQKMAEPFRLIFADGTRIWLKPGSQFRYPADLRRGLDAELWLGEAWFTVRPNLKGLRVRVGEVGEVAVLGTSFDVQCDTANRLANVQVLTGKVSVKSGEDSAVVRQLGIALLQEGVKPRLSRMSDTLCMPAWTRPQGEGAAFNFQNTSLDTALNEIARSYRLRLYYPGGIKGLAVSGRLSRNMPVDELLRSITQAESGQAFVRKVEDTIFVTSR
jgi:ferric-dicitrate binding protein FerR (iron transport regulator)